MRLSLGGPFVRIEIYLINSRSLGDIAKTLMPVDQNRAEAQVQNESCGRGVVRASPEASEHTREFLVYCVPTSINAGASCFSSTISFCTFARSPFPVSISGTKTTSA
jgi:hypothetical protein